MGACALLRCQALFSLHSFPRPETSWAYTLKANSPESQFCPRGPGQPRISFRRSSIRVLLRSFLLRLRFRPPRLFGLMCYERKRINTRPCNTLIYRRLHSTDIPIPSPPRLSIERFFLPQTYERLSAPFRDCGCFWVITLRGVSRITVTGLTRDRVRSGPVSSAVQVLSTKPPHLDRI
ncbi:uncharacterized protein B0T15DRAFT_264888 [Chaetomium strumarium]|uniref:Uncharacterized protein n=1 Tax=Chaetomium strumarium TaxID=1170767 RepID=A0AAJ0LZ87_9PEZI|nr:hypothetical protein B0T15DRAFT_264888 [Chaetomium strumarium]